MATSSVIVVSEIPPRLTALEPEEIRVFLKKLEAYKNRHIGSSEIIPNMRQLIDPEALSCVLELAQFEDQLDSDEDGDSDADLSEEDVSETELQDRRSAKEQRKANYNEKKAFRMSDEGLTELLKRQYGPKNIDSTSRILSSIHMDRHVKPFESLVQATRYTEEWSSSMKWCSLHPLKEKQVVKKFLAGIWPRRLAASLELHEFKKFRDVRRQFLVSYQLSMQAKEVLTATGGVLEFKGDSGASDGVISSTGKSGPKANGPPQKSYGGRSSTGESIVLSVPQKQMGAAGITSSAKSTGNSPVPARGLSKEFKSPIICHRCGKEGHIRPNCPEAEVAAVKTPHREFKADDKIKLSRVIVNRYDRNELPTVVLRVGLETPSVDMRGQLDSCSQIDLIPDKWVSLLEGEGCKFYDVPAEPIGWLDGTPRFHVNRAVDLTCRSSRFGG